MTFYQTNIVRIANTIPPNSPASTPNLPPAAADEEFAASVANSIIY